MPRWSHGSYQIDTCLERLDRDLVREFLAGSYWAAEIPKDVVDAACAGSVCFGLYEARRQVGFARVVSDRATFAWLADVFVLPEHRGRGLSKWLVACVLEHPELQGLRRWMLATRDAHGLYECFGFTALGDPGKFMEIARPGLYRETDPPDQVSSYASS